MLNRVSAADSRWENCCRLVPNTFVFSVMSENDMGPGVTGCGIPEDGKGVLGVVTGVVVGLVVSVDDVDSASDSCGDDIDFSMVTGD